MRFLTYVYVVVFLAMMAIHAYGAEPGTRYPSAGLDNTWYPAASDHAAGMVRVRSQPIYLPGYQPTITADVLTAGQIADRDYHATGDGWSDNRINWIDSAAWVKTTGTQRRSAATLRSGTKVKTARKYTTK